MRVRTFGSTLLATATVTGLALAGLATTPHRATAATGYTVQSLHFAVRVGPDGQQACDIVGGVLTSDGRCLASNL